MFILTMYAIYGCFAVGVVLFFVSVIVLAVLTFENLWSKIGGKK